MDEPRPDFRAAFCLRCHGFLNDAGAGQGRRHVFRRELAPAGFFRGCLAALHQRQVPFQTVSFFVAMHDCIRPGSGA
jgi:hypothetical protein